jgi:hypothetical protein
MGAAEFAGWAWTVLGVVAGTAIVALVVVSCFAAAVRQIRKKR